MVRRFARPYARAIVDVAGSADKANTVRAELAKFEAAVRDSSELRDLYRNPAIEDDAKLKVTSAIASRLGLSQLTGKVLEILVRNGRINDVASVVTALAQFINEEMGIAIAEVKTAQKLGEAEVADLRKTLEKKTGKRVEVRVSEDPSLLGGFVVRIGSEIWDASVAGKITRFRESLT